MAGLIFSMFLLILVILSSLNYQQEFPPSLGMAFWMTVLGLYVDVLLIAAIALLVSTFATSTLMPVAIGMSVAIAGKALGPTLDYLSEGADGQTDLVEGFLMPLEMLRWIFPDLSRLDWRDWALYNMPVGADQIISAVGMALCFIALFLAIACALFERREFS